MEMKEDVVGIEDILDQIVTLSQKENDQKNVEDHGPFPGKTLKDLVMQRFGGKEHIIIMHILIYFNLQIKNAPITYVFYICVKTVFFSFGKVKNSIKIHRFLLSWKLKGMVECFCKFK